MADLEARLLGAQRDADAAERRAELAERQSAEAHRLILDMQARPCATGYRWWQFRGRLGPRPGFLLALISVFWLFW